MDNNNQPITTNSTEPAPENKDENLIPRTTFALVVVGIVGLLVAASDKSYTDFMPSSSQKTAATINTLEEQVLPSEGITLPVTWGGLGAKMISVGVIDPVKFEAIYSARGGLTKEEKELLYGSGNGKIKITRENSGVLLNLLWALGLGNKNEILEKGPMTDQRYGGAENFASTGGWTISKGSAMEYYSQHPFILLNEEQQKLVESVSGNIYRPCCNNPTYFPDCNHGMAMLGLLELMASQGVPENEMYKFALQVNSYWFPDTYLTIAKYLELKGVTWKNADAKEVLGAGYSSASGYQRVLSKVTPPENSGGGSCGV
ncbi:MAG: hypothetical protein Q7R91_00965 [bacterium]|nr:hypothetical protein [bacterium]